MFNSVIQDTSEEEQEEVDVYWYVQELVQQLEQDKQRLDALEATECRHTQRYTDLATASDKKFADMKSAADAAQQETKTELARQAKEGISKALTDQSVEARKALEKELVDMRTKLARQAKEGISKALAEQSAEARKVLDKELVDMRTELVRQTKEDISKALAEQSAEACKSVEKKMIEMSKAVERLRLRTPTSKTPEGTAHTPSA